MFRLGSKPSSRQSRERLELQQSLSTEWFRPRLNHNKVSQAYHDVVQLIQHMCILNQGQLALRRAVRMQKERFELADAAIGYGKIQEKSESWG